FFQSSRLYRTFHSFPTRRSSDLDLQASVLSHGDPALVLQEVRRNARAASRKVLPTVEGPCTVLEVPEVRIKRVRGRGPRLRYLEDRKSTRLNSSHVAISYAVFCL